MLIQVKAEHIKYGARGSCSGCPVALAIHETTGIYLDITPIGAWIQSNYILLPIEVIDFMDDFDKQRAVEPFEFDLPIAIEPI